MKLHSEIAEASQLRFKFGAVSDWVVNSHPQSWLQLFHFYSVQCLLLRESVSVSLQKAGVILLPMTAVLFWNYHKKQPQTDFFSRLFNLRSETCWTFLWLPHRWQFISIPTHFPNSTGCVCEGEIYSCWKLVHSLNSHKIITTNEKCNKRHNATFTSSI